MIIKNSSPVSMAECQEYLSKDIEKDKELVGFIKKFTKITPKEAKEMRKKLSDLDLIKIKEEHISKIIDLLPETQEELNKIFVDVGLNDDESKKILDTVKQYK